MKKVLFIIIATVQASVFAQYIPPGGQRDRGDDARFRPAADDNIRGIVRNISAVADGSSVRITWVNTGMDDDIIIARSESPIISLESLLKSKSVGVVSGVANSFQDVAVPPGSWYYAVASRSSIRNSTLRLVVGANYTGRPVNVGQGLSGVRVPQVSLIFAQVMPTGAVRVSWRGVSTRSVIYTVYRSQEPLGQSDRLMRAQKIAIITSGATFYEDRDLPGSGQYYYAVTTSVPGGREDFELIPDQSYTRNPVLVSNGGVPIVLDLKAEPDPSGRTGRTIRLTWRDAPSNEDVSYEVYRSTQPMLPDTVQTSGTLIASLPYGNREFLDEPPVTGSFYYAIVSVATDGQRSSKFVPGANLLITPVSNAETAGGFHSEPVAGAAEIQFLTAKSTDKGTLLRWQVMTGLTARSIQVYRFPEKPGQLRDLIKGSLIARLSIQETSYLDAAPPGENYYAVFAETQSGLRPAGFNNGLNVTGPVGSGGNFPSAEDLFDDSAKTDVEDLFAEEIEPAETELRESMAQTINVVLRQTYLTRQYRAAVDALSIYRNSSDPRVKAKAHFYTGLSLYRMGNYSEAVDHFVQPDVRKAYSRQAKFWYRKSLENM